MILRGAKVFLPEGQFRLLDVRIEEGRIAEVGEGLSGGDVIPVEGFLIPGMIDLHTHGYGGVDTMQGEEAVQSMSLAYARRGVTTFLPTTMNAPIPETAAAVAGIGRAMRSAKGAKVLGAHVEGPFIDEVYKGAQLASAILPPSVDRLLELCGGSLEDIRLLTIAPETEGAEDVIRYASERGVLVSAGHTAATYEQAERAIGWGATQCTHLFNAMTPIHHRAPGVPTAYLTDVRATVQLIADGIHTHPGILRLVAMAKRDDICLVTDSMMAAGLPEGTYELGGQDVIVKGGEARLESGALAGSTLTMDEALMRMVRFSGLKLEEVVPMTSAIPARALGEKETGEISPGMFADLCLLGGDLRPATTWVEGVAFAAGEGG